MNRRTFIKTAATAGGAAAILPQTLFSSGSKKRVKIGFIGMGLRGQWMLWLASKYQEVEIPAICDIDNGMIDNAVKILQDGGKPDPHIYNNGEEVARFQANIMMQLEATQDEVQEKIDEILMEDF